jgi:outer membrane protein OmpA-like peptidoglycan-associated protein
MAHIVAIGAHDGHGQTGPYQLRRVQPNRGKQYKSWFDPEAQWLHYDGNPIVGQIYFPTADIALDHITDRIVLDAVIAEYRFHLGQMVKVELEFVGHADPRGADTFNTKLAQQRAGAVQRYVDNRISKNAGAVGQLFRYQSKASSLGESAPSGDYAADRRVDIVLRSVKARSYVQFDSRMITGENTGPLTDKISFRGWGAVGGGIKIVGFDAAEIEIRNENTGKSAFYTYTGVNIGWSPKWLPVSFSEPVTEYTPREVPFGFVDVDDFEGPGSISSAMVRKGGQCLIFTGPKLAHSKKVLKKDGVEFCFEDKAWQIGASAGIGHWKRQPYRTAAERETYLLEQARRRQKHESQGPKY